MPSLSTITDVSVATIQGQLPAPVIFGDWVMKQREFVVVRMRTAVGPRGLGVHADPRRRLRRADPQDDRAGLYRHRHRRPGEDVQDRQGTDLRLAQRRHRLAGAFAWWTWPAWDLAAKLEDKSDRRILGGKAEPMPATAIIGYPPALMPPDKIGEQVREPLRRRMAPLQGADGRDAGRIGSATARSARRSARRLARHGPGLDVHDRRCRRRLCEQDRRPRHGLHRGHLPARQRRQARRAAQARADADLARRRTGRLLLSGGADHGQVGRSGSRRPDLHGRHHRRPRNHRRVSCRRRRFRPAHVRACPQPGVQRLGLFDDKPVEWGVPWTRRRPIRRQPDPAGDHRGRADEAAARRSRASATCSTATGR